MNQKLEEFNKYLIEKNVAIIGLGVSNLPLLKYMNKKGANVTVFDDREETSIPKEALQEVQRYDIPHFFGKSCLDNLKGFDIIFRSPSCMPTKKELVKEETRGAIVTTEIEMLMKLCPGTVIGVTGSDGKTTTTSIIYEIVKTAGYKCYLGGNIGTPLFTKLGEMEEKDIVVLELSSFQLMNMSVSPKISVITNISPNHLNVHSSYEEYIEAKENIYKHQDRDGIVVLNYDNDITRKLAKKAEGQVVLFSRKTKLEDGIIVDGNMIKECNDRVRRHVISSENIHLRGMHNYENICAAIAATKSLTDIDTQIKAIKNFRGVEHRIEFVREIEGVKWYNDSIGTSPTRTMAGLSSFEEKIILIAGGYDKHLDYEQLAKPILDNVRVLILMGQTAEKIFVEVKKESEKERNRNINIYV
jgi:UDP-N-acetylmuramoylalanine--D-glutamate ligase